MISSKRRGNILSHALFIFSIGYAVYTHNLIDKDLLETERYIENTLATVEKQLVAMSNRVAKPKIIFSSDYYCGFGPGGRLKILFDNQKKTIYGKSYSLCERKTKEHDYNLVFWFEGDLLRYADSRDASFKKTNTITNISLDQKGIVETFEINLDQYSREMCHSKEFSCR